MGLGKGKAINVLLVIIDGVANPLLHVGGSITFPMENQGTGGIECFLGSVR
jgi:hypothetical protein